VSVFKNVTLARNRAAPWRWSQDRNMLERF